MPPDLAAATGVSKRCLISLGGRTLLERMLALLRETFTDPRIITNLGGDEEGLEFVALHGANVTHYCCGGGLLEAVIAGIDEFVKEQGAGFCNENLLLVNVDVPLVTAAHLAELLSKMEELQADGVWPIVERKIVQERFPTTKRTYIRTRQGTYTGGNIFVVKPRLIRDNHALLGKALRSRKNPLALASVFSPRILLGVLAGTVSLSELEEEFSQRFNARLRCLPFPHPEVSVDLDKLSDYILIKSLLG
ncbi:MAG: hypothetical protein A2Y63_06830 [Candidatus Riflebacteria bacterium RBG_13_59_9]|nr:MAG: hypothetical protein A2Y63_06830 [Candidatus Riflebacteria bacterium RBG_13_59_9]